jgi:phytoene synthase
MRALADAVSRYEIATDRLTEMIDGAQLDLDYNRYPDFATLEMYCARTGGAATLLSAAILGSSAPETTTLARELGIALELARIVRDVGRDSRRNRIYIPLDELRRFDLDSDDIIALREDERFERLMAMQIERARARIDAAVAALPAGDRRTQKPHIALARMWRALLDEIAQLRGHTLNQQVALTPLRKLWIAWRTRVS